MKIILASLQELVGAEEYSMEVINVQNLRQQPAACCCGVQSQAMTYLDISTPPLL